MSKEKYNAPTESESGVTVNVDVAKVVKYVCVAGVLIVAIIFGSRCVSNIFK